MNDIEEISAAILNSENMLLASHENPDYDALGSMLALAIGLKSIGKDIELYNSNKIPNQLKFLPEWKIIKNELSQLKGNYDSILL